MLLIALLLSAAAASPEVVPLADEAQVKELCQSLRPQPSSPDLDPAQAAEARKAADARREDAASRWYRVEVPSKGFSFGRYRAKDRQIELDGDRPLRALDGMLSLDVDGTDDVTFDATPEQVSAWSKEKKAGTLRLGVVFKPSGERCAGSAAAQAWRIAGKARSWELLASSGSVAAANADGEPVNGPRPKSMRIEKVALDSDEGPSENEGRARLEHAQGALDRCVSGARRRGSLVLSFSVQSGRVRDAQVIMDSARDEKVARCVSQAVDGAQMSGNGHGTAALSLD
jgi:hypothetical protein